MFCRGLDAELRSTLGWPERGVEAAMGFEDPEVGVSEYVLQVCIPRKYALFLGMTCVFLGMDVYAWEWMCIPRNGCAFLGMTAYSWE